MIPPKILLGHGSGGRLMHELIRELMLKKLDNPILRELSDSAFIDYKGNKLAFSTDSFVVNPLDFPGGDIGKLAVCGTANDLLMLGAVPQYLSLALIIEEGFENRILERIISSIAETARRAKISFVTGDTKVVERGACDKIFINTSGIGRITGKRRLSLRSIKAGDRIIVTGNIGQHGLAVMAQRQGFDAEFRIKSDCAYLGPLLLPALNKSNGVKFMRDPTRGGLAATLNEIVGSTDLGIMIEEKDVPVAAKTRAACELLGIDPLCVANEGNAVIAVKEKDAGRMVRLLRRNSLGRHACVVGYFTAEHKGQVILNTTLGTQRIIDMPSNEPLPRIC